MGRCWICNSPLKGRDCERCMLRIEKMRREADNRRPSPDSMARALLVELGIELAE